MNVVRSESALRTQAIRLFGRLVAWLGRSLPMTRWNVYVPSRLSLEERLEIAEKFRSAERLILAHSGVDPSAIRSVSVRWKPRFAATPRGSLLVLPSHALLLAYEDIETAEAIYVALHLVWAAAYVERSSGKAEDRVCRHYAYECARSLAKSSGAPTRWSRWIDAWAAADPALM